VGGWVDVWMGVWMDGWISFTVQYKIIQIRKESFIENE
jgi:hypothetical protein